MISETMKSVLEQRFYKHESSCTEEDIRAFEKKVNLRLPEDYKHFLLKYNGGVAENMLVYPMKYNKRDTQGSLQRFFGLLPDTNHGLFGQYNVYHKPEKRMVASMLPIGRDGGGNKICLLLSEEKYGSVYFWDHDDEVDFDDEEEAREPMRNCYYVADSFTSFMNLLSEYEDDDE